MSLRVLVGSELTVAMAPLHPDDLEVRREKSPVPIAPAPTREELREAAQDTLAQLNPATDEEAERIEHWRSEIPHFGSVAWINFLTYQQLSIPYAGKPTNPPVGTSYSHTRNYPNTTTDKPLDFRMGLDDNQDGYFDYGYSELRIAPRAPNQLTIARRRVLRSLSATALRFGYGALVHVEHLNGSVYDGEKPLLGDPAASMEPYQRAAAGLIRLHGEAAFYAGSDFSQGVGDNTFSISHHRSSHVRMIPGRFEYRHIYPPREDGERTQPSFVAALRYGFTHSTAEDIAAIDTTALLRIERSSEYKKEEDLEIYRILECYQLNTAGDRLMLGSAGLPHSIVDARSTWSHIALSQLTGRDLPVSRAYTSTVDLLLCAAMKVSDEGYLEWDEERLRHILNTTDASIYGPGGEELKSLNLTAAEKAELAVRLRRFRINGNTPVVYHQSHANFATRRLAYDAMLRATAWPQVDPKTYEARLAEMRANLRR